MNSNFERYEESIQILIHSRTSVLDRCRVTYKYELSGKLEQYKTSMVIVNVCVCVCVFDNCVFVLL